MIVLIMAIGTGYLVFSMAEKRGIEARRNARTAAAFNLVKQALVGWSASRTPTPSNLNARPGELPCPDTDNSGYAENDDDNDAVDEANCVAGVIGRVPWKTLGIPEPIDASGETLWYALSGNFRIYRAATPNIFTSPITSDTLGTLTVYQNSTATTQTTQAVAVLFAPGPAFGTQDRSATSTMSCTAPSGTYARNQCSSNYLETSGGVNNAGLNGPYIQAPASGTFNDRLLAITNADLMPVVEQRVAIEMMSLLNKYRAGSTGNVYPWADLGDGASNGTPGTAAYNRGRFPCRDALPNVWGSGTIPALPNWLSNGCTTVSGWPGVIYYAAATNNLENLGTGCTTPGCAANSGLNVNNSGFAYLCTYGASVFSCPLTPIASGTGNYLILITPGGWNGSAHFWSATDWSPVTGYFEDSQNGDHSNDIYTIPTSTATNRDRMFIMQ